MNRSVFRVRKRGRGGVTLVELVVAMAVLFIVSLGLLETARIAVEFNVRNAIREEAVRVTEQTLDSQIRTNSFTVLAAAAGAPPDGTTITLGPVTRQIRRLNVTYDVQRTLTLLDANIVRIAVQASYTRRGATVPVVMTSLVRNRP
jgi:type II secretory pathway pseudopilin PulG